MKTDFKPFKIGKVYNPISVKKTNLKPAHRKISIKFPSRLNAMALDPSKITSNKNLVYTPGEVVFIINIYKYVSIKVTNKKNIEISKTSLRKSLIMHTAILMKKALKFKNGLYIDVKNEKELKHCGLGSSSNLIAAVAVAINELYGNPISPDILARYVAQNHGEELDDKKDYIMPVQCIGGSAIGGLYSGGIKVLAGETCLIKTMEIPSKYKVVIGVPEDFKSGDSKEMLELEIKNFSKFLTTGEKYKEKISYNILHKLLPAMTMGDIKTIGDVIFDYRFNMGSIRNCSFAYPKLIKITNQLVTLKEKGIADVLAISSVGPGIFAITKYPKICEKAFQKQKLKTFLVNIENNKYKIVKNARNQ